MLLSLIMALLLSACATQLEEGEVLYTGMKPTVYHFPDEGIRSKEEGLRSRDEGNKGVASEGVASEKLFTADDKLALTTELDAVLACAPNGALFGSSFYRTPFPYGLWIWNAFSGKKGAIPRWLVSTFGKAPVLLSDVNPELRLSVANNVLANNGFFRASSSYKIIDEHKIQYTINTGPLYRIESFSHHGFTPQEEALLASSPSLLQEGAPFTVSSLDNERTRVYNTLRDNGYYYYQNEYTTFLADTIQHPQHVQLRMQKLDSIPDEASRQWTISRVRVNLRRRYAEQFTDSLQRRTLQVFYAGKRPPVRPRIIMKDLQLRRGQLFSQTQLEKSVNNLVQKGMFSSVDISFTPSADDSLAMTVDCILDKPFDLTLSANYTHKSNGRLGPGAGIGFGMRNAFRGGELLSLNVSGSYEFGYGKGATSKTGSYDIKTDLSLELPRLLLPDALRPDIRRRNRSTYATSNNTANRTYTTSNTIISVARETINRKGYYRRHVLSGELTYTYQPNEVSRHAFTPLGVDYAHVAMRSEAFDDSLKTIYKMMAFQDNFIPKMRYTYTYTSPSRLRNPISFSATITESGNITNAILSMGSNHSWNEKDKTLFNVEVSQFLKLDLSWRKTWRVAERSTLLLNAFGGYIYSYGNADTAPFTENYYLGGANDLRGFSTRSVGPGNVHFSDDEEDARDWNYYVANGNVKLKASLEYRPHLFGSLYGAMFIDAGGVWDQTWAPYDDEETHFGMHWKSLFNDIAVDAGIGIRYDLDFFVLRLDWGFIVHAPYDTGRSGYFNTPRFSRAQCLNFAIGYPF